MKEIVKLNNVTHRYDSRGVAGISDFSLSIKRNKVTCLMGPTGSGKTTTLRIISNELEPQSGNVEYAKDFKISYVEQKSHLDESQTVFDFLKANVEDIVGDEKIENHVRNKLSLLEITDQIHRPISSLSGGQRQRLILAKSLVKNPSVILLDEPFSHLDESLRLELMDDLFRIFQEEDIAVIWVTHNLKEAFGHSDYLYVINHGVIQQHGTPANLYLKPHNIFVARFLGISNIIISSETSKNSTSVTCKIFNKEIVLKKPNEYKDLEHKEVALIFRPEDIHIAEDGNFSGKVIKQIYQGGLNLLYIKVQSTTLKLYSHKSTSFIENTKIKFNIDIDQIHLLREL